MKILYKTISIILASFALAGCLIGCNSARKTIRLESNSEYTIESSVSEVTIVGDDNGELMYGVCITIEKREKDLTINLDNVNFVASYNKPAIYCENTAFTLTVRYKGKSEIIGGSGSYGEDGVSGIGAFPWNWYGKDGAPGQCALSCGKVKFESSDNQSQLILKGGNGGRGGDAGSSDMGCNIYVVTDKPNGGNGGNGASALICKNGDPKHDGVDFIAGYGGSGGKSGYCRIIYVYPIYGQDGQSGKTPSAITSR